ncbi:hypothetical protein LINPERHAP2_LOCUS27299 [Linum perenne]
MMACSLPARRHHLHFLGLHFGCVAERCGLPIDWASNHITPPLEGLGICIPTRWMLEVVALVVCSRSSAVALPKLGILAFEATGKSGKAMGTQ